jgi:hypothetical protein
VSTDPSRGWTLPKAAGFWVLAVAFMMLFFASAAASPLYGVYAVRFQGFIAAVFIVSYLAFSIPALIAGAATSRFDLPPGPCTVPPCLPVDANPVRAPRVRR